MVLAINLSLYTDAIRDTLYMTITSSFLSYVIGIPLGILLYMTNKDGMSPNSIIYNALSTVVNIFRSIPFIILLILVLPFTHFLVHTTIGAKAVIPPLVISASPYIARMVESSLKEVDLGVIEAAKAMGATKMQIVMKVLLSESRPSLLVGAAISVTTILGYSAMAGAVGGGGLGDVAIKYGYIRYNQQVMLITVVLLIIIVQVLQGLFMSIANKTDKRLK
ncbi:MAG: ABC transporter permease [Lachnospiraceae bacterium]|nr:ABC transporter permease [Lachnospiraceae bacterium]